MLKNCAVFALLLSSVIGCDSADRAALDWSGDRYAGSYPIQVVVTVGMVGDTVRNVGGQHIQVTQICGSGVDPHLYKPTRDDVQIIMSTDMVFYCGLTLEGKMSDTLIKIARRKPVFAVTEMIEENLLLEPEQLEGHYDPHVWMDVAAWSQTVDAVESALSDFDPTHAADYKSNAAAYKAKLRACISMESMRWLRFQRTVAC